MTETTPLDKTYMSMQEAPDDDAARLRYYECLSASELFLMLASDPGVSDDTVTPELFELQDASYVLVFDREERLAAFAGQTTPYVALSGRAIAEMLAGQSIGLGVNLDVAVSSIVLPPEAVVWLKDTLGNAPDALEARISEVTTPAGLPEQLISSLDARLASAMGLAHSAYLVGATYDDGSRGHLLGYIDAVPQAQDALTRVAVETLSFSGIDAGAMDVAFFESSDPATERLEKVGLRFDLPQLQDSVTRERPAPGMDPKKPPRLK